MTTLEQVPVPPEGSVFSLAKVEKVSIPHPYCITARHMEIASDQFCGMLGEAAIEAAEKQGAHCGMQRCNLRYDQHKTSETLFIRVPQNKDLNAVPGLHAYLLLIKDKATELGIEGFAFPV